jgi:DNA polymerase type B, organellar and viral
MTSEKKKHRPNTQVGGLKKTPLYLLTLERKQRKQKAKPARIVAYDFETTRIAEGTPDPLYLTAYGGEGGMSIETPITSLENLLHILETWFLTPENYSTKFVAWYGNKFDVYFVSRALLLSKRYYLRPYLTTSKQVRGLRVGYYEDLQNDKNIRSWEFLDGAAMLGFQGVSLEKFLANFAPELPKLTGVIDFEKEQFDPSNVEHCNYAMRDSVGLYAAMSRAQSIVLDKFNEPLAVTMGGTCIKIFQAHIPRDIKIRFPRREIVELVRNYAMRGGYCFCVRKYRGKVWKYDINQAYAAAMRETKLPHGFSVHTKGSPPPGQTVYFARVSATHADNIVPFYYRTLRNQKIKSVFSYTRIDDTWLCSSEVEQLHVEGWNVTIAETYGWSDTFSMGEYVDRLETGRINAEGGPSGPIGTLYKNIGNHSYGKTVERLDGLEYLLALEAPEGFAPYYQDPDGEEPTEHLYWRFGDRETHKAYHQPQIGACITAHVRMVIRRAILRAPESWLYADTDCVMFDQDVTDLLDIDAKRYGAFKIEEAGAEYFVLGKKVYSEIDEDKPASFLKRSSKGLNVKRLTSGDYEQWHEGNAPVQEQVQRVNYLRTMLGENMFRKQIRKGTDIEKINRQNKKE